MRREGCIRKGKSDARFEGAGDFRPVNFLGRSLSSKGGGCHPSQEQWDART